MLLEGIVVSPLSHLDDLKRAREIPYFYFQLLLYPLRSGVVITFVSVILSVYVKVTNWGNILAKSVKYSVVNWFINLFPMVSSLVGDRIITVAKKKILRAHIYYSKNSYVLFLLCRRNHLLRTHWEGFTLTMSSPQKIKCILSPNDIGPIFIPTVNLWKEKVRQRNIRFSSRRLYCLLL